MTLREAQNIASSLGLRLRKVDGEYQLKPANTLWSADTTYFTDCLADAVGTAALMGKAVCELCGTVARLTDGYCDDCSQVVLDAQMEGGYAYP